MHVVKMSFEIVFRFQRVFPKLGLPNTTPPVSNTAGGASLLLASQRKPGLREFFFDPAPAFGEVVVARWKRPNGMQVIGQQNDGVDCERPFPHTPPHDASQQRPRRNIDKKPSPSIGDDRKEKRTAGNVSASPIWHETIIPSESAGTAGPTALQPRSTPNLSCDHRRRFWLNGDVYAGWQAGVESPPQGRFEFSECCDVFPVSAQGLGEAVVSGGE